MPESRLPERASLEYLKKVAKERLPELRKTKPGARLADAQLAVAREYGFSSWRALKAEVERREMSPVEAFFAAAAQGDLAALRALLDRDPSLVTARHKGTTALHLSVRHPEAARLLLERGADPNAREEGDNALPLHWAAGGAPIESVRLLLDAGSDVHGAGDDHKMDVIGWACVFSEARHDVVALLLARGARHNVFSAVATGDVPALRKLVAEDPRALERRLSRHEQEQTALHYVVAPADGLAGGRFRTGEHYRTLDALIELGADLEARDAKGRTPLERAMLRGDQEAMRRLHAAGAKLPSRPPSTGREGLAALGTSAQKVEPMFGVPDLEATVAWYRSIGWELTGEHGEEGKLDFAHLSFGQASVMFVPSSTRRPEEPGRRPPSGTSLWIQTSRLDDLYALLKNQQLERSRALLAGEQTEIPEVKFTADLYTAFYGQREFGFLDPNGLELMFAQPV